MAAGFWERHALLAGITASVIVVMLSAAVVNELVERRRRQRWSVLAQYVMFELVRNARMIWTTVVEIAGLVSMDLPHAEWVDQAARSVRDTPRLDAAVRALVAHDDRWHTLRQEIAKFAHHSDETLGRWAAVMLNGDMYAEVLDRHVELTGEVVWLGDVLDNAEPPADLGRTRKARSSAAARVADGVDDGWVADRIVTITQSAEELDRGTLDIALRIVPVTWWEERLGTAPSIVRAGTRG